MNKLGTNKPKKKIVFQTFEAFLIENLFEFKALIFYILHVHSHIKTTINSIQPKAYTTSLQIYAYSD